MARRSIQVLDFSSTGSGRTGIIDARWRRRLIVFGLWISLLVVALLLDHAIIGYLQSVRSDRFIDRHAGLYVISRACKELGHYPIALAIIAALMFLHPLRWRAAAFLSAACLFGFVGGLVKWMIGRHRPPAPWRPQVWSGFAPFHAGGAGLFQQVNLSMPSGHATLAFAIATALAILLPRWRWWFYAAAMLTGAQRILETAHYPSDVVVAAALSVGGVHLLAVAALRAAPNLPRNVPQERG